MKQIRTIEEYRAFVYWAFDRIPGSFWGRARYECRTCGQGDITDVGRYRHIRQHLDDPVTRLGKLHDVAIALWGAE